MDSSTMDIEGLKEFKTPRKVKATIEISFRPMVGDGPPSPYPLKLIKKKKRKATIL